jgi:glyoxylase-like metal-dependent hydrolase (beta-lactamase superfamily II)
MPDIVMVRPALWLVETAVEDFQVRGAVVAGNARAVVWDTLARPAHMAGVADLVPDLPITVVYSHGDWDHAWGTVGLSRPWSEVLAHEACVARFSGVLPALYHRPSGTPAAPLDHPVEVPASQGDLPGTLEEKRRATPGEYDDVVLVSPTRTFRHSMVLDLGGVTLELHPLPGHTPDTVVGLVPEWGVFLGGDAVEVPLPFLNPGSPLEAWAQGLEGWARRLEEWPGGGTGRRRDSAAPPDGAPPGAVASPSVLVIPSHGPLGGPELLRDNVRYLRDLLAGKEPDLPRDLPPFYVQTHHDNRSLVRRESQRQPGHPGDPRPGGPSDPPPGRKDRPCP